MTKEEARNVFGGSIVNNLLSLGAEPTNVVRQDGLIEWKSDGCIEVGGVHVWAYYYFEDGEDVDRCDWADHMEFVAKELSNAYNSGCVSIYEAKDKTLRYSVYRDGCFYPYYGKLEVVE